jgi:phage virion morphogenesis protein
MIEIKLDDARVMSALKRLQRVEPDIHIMLEGIGENLLESTIRRIERKGPGPGGETWDKNSDVTMALAKMREPPEKPLGNRPLINFGRLLRSFSKKVRGNELTVGTNRPFAEVHQFGTLRAGRGHKVRIPARPFLGISDEDSRKIESLILNRLAALLKSV